MVVAHQGQRRAGGAGLRGRNGRGAQPGDIGHVGAVADAAFDVALGVQLVQRAGDGVARDAQDQGDGAFAGQAGELDTHQCIAFGWVDGNVSPWSFAADPDGATQRRPVPARLVLGNGEALLMAAVAGNGIAQLPSWLIQQQLADGTLVEVLPHLASEGLPIHLAWIKSRQALPRVGALLQILTDELTAQ